MSATAHPRHCGMRSMSPEQFYTAGIVRHPNHQPDDPSGPAQKEEFVRFVIPLAVLLTSVSVVGGAFAADMKTHSAHTTRGNAMQSDDMSRHPMQSGEMRHSSMMHHRRHASMDRIAMGNRSNLGMRAATQTAAAKPAGSCGTFMYWKAGKCMDARNPPKAAWKLF